MTKLGIDSIKKAVLGLVQLGVTIDKDMEDGKLNTSEKIEIGIKSITTGVTIATNWGDIRDQYKDMDDTERQEIKDYVASELDLDNDYVEAKIEAAFDIAVAVEKFISIKKPAA